MKDEKKKARIIVILSPTGEESLWRLNSVDSSVVHLDSLRMTEEKSNVGLYVRRKITIGVQKLKGSKVEK